MNDFIKSALRELAQKLVGIVVIWLAAHGLPVPDAVSSWGVLALVGGGVAVWTIIVRWLESINSPFASWLARVLMLGIGERPTYVKPPVASS